MIVHNDIQTGFNALAPTASSAIQSGQVAERRQEAGGDTVSISDEGRQLSENMHAGQAAAATEEENGLAAKPGKTGKAAKEEASEEDPATSIEAIRKRIQNLKKQLQQARQELMEARAESARKSGAHQEHAFGLAADAAEMSGQNDRSAEDGPGENQETESAQAKVDMLNAELLQAQADLAQALKGSA